MKKWLCFAFIPMILCSACSAELYDRLLIHAIGVDRTDDGYAVTVRAAREGEEDRETVLSGEGKTVYLALDSIKLKTGKQALYSHNYLVILGRSCCERGVEHMLDFFSRHFETRPSVKLFMAENTAEEILKVKQNDELIASDSLENMIDREVSSGNAVNVRVLDFINAQITPGMAAFLPVLAARGESVELTGTGIFSGDRLADRLGPDETMGLLAVHGELSGATYVLQNETDTAVSVRIDRIKAAVSADDENPFCCTVRLRCDADIVAFDGEGGWTEETLSHALEEKIQRQMEAAVSAALYENRCDVFGFGLCSMQKFPAMKELLQTDAQALAEKFQVKTAVQVHIVHIGGEITPFS